MCVVHVCVHVCVWCMGTWVSGCFDVHVYVCMCLFVCIEGCSIGILSVYLCKLSQGLMTFKLFGEE